MSTTERWFNVYSRGRRGILHPSREICEIAGLTTEREKEEGRAVLYRVHAKLKLAPPLPSKECQP